MTTCNVGIRRGCCRHLLGQSYFSSSKGIHIVQLASPLEPDKKGIVGLEPGKTYGFYVSLNMSYVLAVMIIDR